MRFMVIVKASKESEAGVLPGKEILTEWANSMKNWQKPHSVPGHPQGLEISVAISRPENF